jgi:tetratricopeptide (TPR) repeat protein
VSVLDHLALALWHRGRIRESDDLLQSAYSQLDRSPEPSTRANFWMFGGAVLSFFKHDEQGLRRAAEKLVDIGLTCKMRPIEAVGLGFKAGSLIRSDQHHEGADLLRRAIAYADTLDMKLFRAIYSVFDAEAKMAAQKYDAAIEEVDKGLIWANDTAEHWADVPLLLTKASAMQRADAAFDEIASVIDLAINTATKQGSVSLENRARAALEALD